MTERELIVEFLTEDKTPPEQIKGIMVFIDRAFPEIASMQIDPARIAQEKVKLHGLMAVARAMPFDAVQAEVHEEMERAKIRDN